MKTAYIKPGISVLELETEQIMDTASLPYSDESAQDGVGLSKETGSMGFTNIDLWGEDEED